MSGMMKATVLAVLAAGALAAPHDVRRQEDSGTGVETVHVDPWGGPAWESIGPFWTSTGQGPASPTTTPSTTDPKSKTEAKSKTETTAIPTPTQESSNTSNETKQRKKQQKKHKQKNAPLASASTSSSGTQPSSTGGVDTSAWGLGIAYSPYLNDGDCKVQDDVNTDFQQLTGYGVIRIYGTDCDQTAMVLSAAQANNQLVFAGVYDITQVESEVQTIIDAVNNDWSSIAAVSIGNEGVNDGTYTVSAVVSAVASARSQLQSAGYTGPVVTVDTFDAIIANPQLCQASDFAAANCHAFFDADMTADQAGSYVQQQAQSVQNACGGIDTVITESGWPSNGDANGAAVPSQANQDAAISSLRGAFSNNLILFTAYNNFWQTNNPSTFDAEWWWGIYGNSTTSGPGP